LLPRGIPQTPDEAAAIVHTTAATNANSQSPAHWPHSQIVALSQTVEHLMARIDALESKPKRGRSAKLEEPIVTVSDALVADAPRF
jgi:hypothetical protein